ncbi:MAG: magnesium-translocating P-type ATPase [Candidatus Binatia bacterium]|nr:MAG: magnesium-translocating P-type ATPase [Candidatus Binatia bacterium]
MVHRGARVTLAPYETGLVCTAQNVLYAGAVNTLAAGMSSQEAAQRLEQYGRNELGAARRGGALRQFLSRFGNPLVLVLLFASTVSALTGDVGGAGIIACILLLSVTLDFIQEYRAERAAAALAARVALTAHVVRDGEVREVPVSLVVPGDIVLLGAGDLVPADGVLLEARDVFVHQARLTGEPYPVEKQALSPIWDAGQTNSGLSPETPFAVFLGSSVISGSGRMLVLQTGTRTMLGRIAGTLQRPAPPTAFEIGTRQFGLLIMRFTVALVLFVLLVNLLFERPLLEAFLFAVALAVGLTPELLPMIVSVTLAQGALRMAREKVIVKRLSAVQDLGAVDVLCTDKTGTLTEAQIWLEGHVDPLGNDSPRVLELAYLNSFFETGIKSPLDEAILEHRAVDASGWRKIDEVPFDFERRRVSVLLEQGTRRVLIVKGAPEDILRLCVSYEVEGRILPLDEQCRARFGGLFDQLSEEGLRVLAVAWREVEPTRDHAGITDETELVFSGFVSFLDPPKPTAAKAIQALAATGVQVKILTGDNERVTRNLCRELGVPITGLLTGKEIAELTEEALQARAEECNVFCRLDPMQKHRVLLALKARGHVVAYLGDGINDAPSLHSADVGISVDSAVDVAKQAAALVLLERDLGVLHAGVREGRRTFANVMKYIMMATSSNFGNMFSMAGATLFLPFLPMLPMQILLNNLLYDLSEIPLPLDEVDAEDLTAPRRWDMRFVRDFMVSIGPISSMFDFLTFYVLLALFRADETFFHTGWFVESIATQVLVIFVIRTRRNPLRSRPHPALAVAAFGIVGFAALLPFTPLAPLLGFTPLPPLFFAVLGGIAGVYLLLVEVAKRRFFRVRVV